MACTRARWCQRNLFPLQTTPVLTLGRCVLSKVCLLISAQQALCLGLGSWSSGQLLVEAHHLLHADGIRGCANGLGSKLVTALIFIEHTARRIWRGRVVLWKCAGARRGWRNGLGASGPSRKFIRRSYIGRRNLRGIVSNCLRCAAGRRRHTFGGIRVERPRFCMKLILAATTQSDSIEQVLRRRIGQGDSRVLARWSEVR